jgi:methylmalonyl-CoA mutase
MRSSEEEKHQQIDNLAAFQARHGGETPEALARLQRVAEQRGNVFAEMMEAVKVASLGQVSGALYEVGGIYRRNM